jgi:hypothetical protein
LRTSGLSGQKQMMRSGWTRPLLLACLLLAPACKPRPPAVPLPERLVEIRADEKGFTPERITARPYEPLLLRFTRTDETACVEQVILPGETVKHPLPLRQPVDLRLTAPASGALVFTCGMRMFTGAVVAD